MKKSLFSKFALISLGLLMIICPSCEPKESKAPVPEEKPKLIETGQAEARRPEQVESKDAETKQTESKQPEVKQPDVKKIEAKQPEEKQPEVKQPEEKQPEVKEPKRNLRGKMQEEARQRELELKQQELKAKSEEEKAKVEEEKAKEQTAVKPAAGPEKIVAKISDYTITRGQLEKKLMQELHPYEYEPHLDDGEPINAQTVLLKMIAEKAMMMDGRERNLLKDEMINRSVKRFRNKKLTNLLFKKYMEENLKVTESEIDEKIKAKPNLSQAAAKAEVGKAKATKLASDYYQELYKKLHVRKLRENYPKAAELHFRLLYRPKEERKMSFIRVTQITTELTLEEQNLPLAIYDHGTITMKDWLEVLCDIVPPRRPRDLNTAKGVERLLEIAQKMPIYVSEAKLLGLDKDKDYLKQLREYEDIGLLNKAKQEKHKEIAEPTSDEKKAYYNNNKETLRTDKFIKIDQIWCENLATAKKVRAELDSGKGFEAVKQKYSLDKKSKAFDTDAGNEARFFKELWEGKANEIMGPMKGKYLEQFKWRVVKILEKKPGKLGEYDTQMERRIKWRITSVRQQTLMKKYAKELFEKYPYEIYSEKIKDLDPLNIP